VAAEHRSVAPSLPGVPWWGAVLIAVTVTAVGFAFDAGSGGKELTLAFSALYAIGCIAAVLAVRQSAIFTAVIQPPLVLFVSVPGAYFLFHGAAFTGIKDTLINYGYPLIERFPVMFFTSATVLLIGMGRWYIGMSTRRGAATTSARTSAGSSRLSAVTSKISAILTPDSDDEDVEEIETPRRRQHSIDRPIKAAKPAADRTERAARTGKPLKRAQPSRSRHTRPPDTEIIEPVVDRPRRPRPGRQLESPSDPTAEPRRRPRTTSTREPRKQSPPTERRATHQRPERRRRLEDYEQREPHAGNGSNGSNGTHHPISRVRYRGTDDGDDRTEYRSRPRASRHRADTWEYDA
jgi:hypothetical protein